MQEPIYEWPVLDGDEMEISKKLKIFGKIILRDFSVNDIAHLMRIQNIRSNNTDPKIAIDPNPI